MIRYLNVAAYDVYEVELGRCDSADSASWYKYRGYVILVDGVLKHYRVEAGPGTTPVNCESLEDALTKIDEMLLNKEARL